MRIWIDVENPPQVQYLIPLVAAFRQAGADVVVTARDYGGTYALLEERGESFERVGSSYGREKWRKATGLLGRTAALVRLHARRRPDAVVHAGRAPALAAAALRVASFGFRDYEFTNVTVERYTRSFVLHPRVVPAQAFTEKGIRPERLIAFDGLKEDLTFFGLDLDDVDPFPIPDAVDELAHVLVRPAAEESHYYSSASGEVTAQLLSYLAGRDDVQVIFSPRYEWQAARLEEVEWRNAPVVLRESAPFLRLLKAVDAVVASGGTMVREAAYLGVPAYSVFQGETGGVDRYLADLGRLDLLRSPDDFDRIRIDRRQEHAVLATNPRLPQDVVEAVVARSADG